MIKKILSIILFLLVVVPSQASAQQVGEQIDAYSVDIEMRNDGTLGIKERIDYNFSDQQRHGIKRWIPLRFKEAEKEYAMTITDVNVEVDGASTTPYKKSSNNGIDEIKIGDPKRTIAGKHTYEIRYIIAGGMRYFEEHDELYWNAIGQDWGVPINSANVSVSYPEGVPIDSINTACFTGVNGSVEQACEVFKNNGRIDFASSRVLQAGEGLTIVVGLPAGTITKLLPKEYIPFSQTRLGKLLIAVAIVAGAILALLWYIVYPIWIGIRWFLYGRDPDVGVDPTAVFHGPRVRGGYLTPAETGGLIDEKVDRRDIVAALVDIARRGFLRIEERESKDFYLVRTEQVANAKDEMANFEEKLLGVLFKENSEVRIKDIKNISSELLAVENMIYDRLMGDGFFVKNPKKVRDFYGFISAIAMLTFNFQLLLVSALFGNNMPRKTLKGARAAQQARALLNFLNSQERQLNYQGNMQLLFEKLLPFAVAFGVEKHWIERFADLGIDIAQPTWYAGHSTNFASSFSSFNSIARASAYTHTSTSYSSSGFSGGSSGGGGGGGGGGSW